MRLTPVPSALRGHGQWLQKDVDTSFVTDVHSIFAQQAMFLLKCMDLLAPSLALFVDMELSLLSRYLVPLQKKINDMPLLVCAPHACYIHMMQTTHLFLIHQRFEEIMWLQFFQIYSVQSLAVHFHWLQFEPGKKKHKVNCLIIRMHQQQIKIKWKVHDWRKPLVRACFGVEEVARESTNATQK